MVKKEKKIFHKTSADSCNESQVRNRPLMLWKTLCTSGSI